MKNVIRIGLAALLALIIFAVISTDNDPTVEALEKRGFTKITITGTDSVNQSPGSYGVKFKALNSKGERVTGTMIKHQQLAK